MLIVNSVYLNVPFSFILIHFLGIDNIKFENIKEKKLIVL